MHNLMSMYIYSKSKIYFSECTVRAYVQLVIVSVKCAKSKHIYGTMMEITADSSDKQCLSTA